MTTPSNANCLCGLNEQAEVNVAVYRYGVLQNNVEIAYEIGPDMLPVDTGGKIQLKNGTAMISVGTMARPGFRDLRLKVTIDGTEYAHHTKVGFPPNQI